MPFGLKRLSELCQKDLRIPIVDYTLIFTLAEKNKTRTGFVMQIIFILRFRNKTLLMIYSLYIAHKYTHASLQLNIVLSPAGGIDHIICIFFFTF